jgi:hypothetical protein
VPYVLVLTVCHRLLSAAQRLTAAAAAAAGVVLTSLTELLRVAVRDVVRHA